MGQCKGVCMQCPRYKEGGQMPAHQTKQYQAPGIMGRSWCRFMQMPCSSIMLDQTLFKAAARWICKASVDDDQTLPNNNCFRTRSLEALSPAWLPRPQLWFPLPECLDRCCQVKAVVPRDRLLPNIGYLFPLWSVLFSPSSRLEFVVHNDQYPVWTGLHVPRSYALLQVLTFCAFRMWQNRVLAEH